MSRSGGSSRAPIAPVARRWRCLAALLLIALVLAACAGPSAEPTATVFPVPTATTAQPEPSAVPEATGTPAPPQATATSRPSSTATVRPTSAVTATRRPTSTPGAPTETPIVLTNPSALARLSKFTLGGKEKELPLLAVGGSDGKTLFAGRGGVVRSRDGGTSWTSVRTEDEAPRVTALAVAPSKQDLVFVGVNEGCAKTTKQPGYVSSDGGDTWKQFGNGILSLAIDPKSAETVYAIDCEGLKRTTSRGATWETLTVPKLSGGTKALIGIAPSNTDHLYLAIPIGATTTVIYHSADRGATWKGITPAIVANLEADKALPGGDKNIAKSAPLALALDAEDPLIALVSTTYGVFRTEDGGKMWLRLDGGLENTTPPGTLPNDQNGSRVNTALVADPTRAGAFWVGTGTATAKGMGLYRTRNNGESWRKPITGLEGKAISALAVGGTARERILFIVTDDGLWAMTGP